MNQLVDPMFWPLTRWAEHSQQRACRNAMVASTALTVSRRERDEVEEFVQTTLARRHPGGPARPGLSAARHA